MTPYHNHRGDDAMRQDFESGAARLVGVVALVALILFVGWVSYHTGHNACYRELQAAGKIVYP
jgi:hypothetical protein